VAKVIQRRWKKNQKRKGWIIELRQANTLK
jgi:hypothetical protein